MLAGSPPWLGFVVVSVVSVIRISADVAVDSLVLGLVGIFFAPFIFSIYFCLEILKMNIAIFCESGVIFSRFLLFGEGVVRCLLFIAF